MSIIIDTTNNNTTITRSPSPSDEGSIKKMKIKKTVSFEKTVKEYDGLLPINALFNDLTIYYCSIGGMSSCADMEEYLGKYCNKNNYGDFKQYLDKLINCSECLISRINDNDISMILPCGGGNNVKLNKCALKNINHMILVLKETSKQYNPLILLKKKIDDIISYLLTIINVKEHDDIYKLFSYDPDEHIDELERKLISFQVKEREMIEHIIINMIIYIRSISDRLAFNRLVRNGICVSSEWFNFIGKRKYGDILLSGMPLEELKKLLNELKIIEQNLLNDEEEMLLSEIESDLDEY
jgi:hypothetical protein